MASTKVLVQDPYVLGLSDTPIPKHAAELSFNQVTKPYLGPLVGRGWYRRGYVAQKPVVVRRFLQSHPRQDFLLSVGSYRTRRVPTQLKSR